MCRILILCFVPAVLGIIIRDPPPSPADYKYSYDIEDPYTGDSKSQHEVRQGDFVSGAYSVVGPDGTKRTVEYTVDSAHGFQAVVREEPFEGTSPQPMMKIPYVSKTRFYTKPLYTLEGVKLPIQNKESENGVYFTPANEIVNERFLFENGKYFEPAE